MKLKKFFVIASVLLTGCTKDVVDPVPMQELPTAQIILDKNQTSQKIYLKNIGGTSLDWSLDISNSYLQADLLKGTVNGGDSVGITITADLTKTTAQSISSTQVLFKFPKTFDQAVPVTVVNYTEAKWRFPSIIVKAMYSRSQDVILAIAKDENKLLIINPEERSIKEVAIDFPGTSLSVSPDGTHAMIGHNAAVTSVDLLNLKVEKTFGLPFDVSDAIVSDANFAYLCEGNSQWTNLTSIDLSSGDEKASPNDLYSDSRGKLHPSGKYLYVISTRLYPPNIDRFDVQGGQAQYIYYSYWGGDYPMGDDFWFSEDGLTYYANSGNIFTVDNSNPYQFLTYQAKLSNIDYYGIYTFDYSSAAQRICLVNKNTYYPADAPQNSLLSFDLSNQFLSSQTLEPFLMKNNAGTPVLDDGLGFFAFFNAAGTKVYVIQRSRSSSPEVWAVETISLR